MGVDSDSQAKTRSDQIFCISVIESEYVHTLKFKTLWLVGVFFVTKDFGFVKDHVPLKTVIQLCIHVGKKYILKYILKNKTFKILL